MKNSPLTLQDAYKKTCPLLMLKIGDWKQYDKDAKVCGLVCLQANDVRILKLLERMGLRLGLYPEKGEKKVCFHDTNISVVYGILFVRSVRMVEIIGGVHVHGTEIRSIGK